MDVRFCARQEPLPRGIECALRVLQSLFWALSRAPQEDHGLLLTKIYMEVGYASLCPATRNASMQETQRALLGQVEWLHS